MVGEDRVEFNVMLYMIKCQSEMRTGVERPVLAVFTRENFEGMAGSFKVGLDARRLRRKAFGEEKMPRGGRGSFLPPPRPFSLDSCLQLPSGRKLELLCFGEDRICPVL